MAQHVVIVGNGIAGITAARHLRKRSSDAAITVISGESDHFYSRTALMYVYMGHMRYQDIKPYDDGFWARNRIGLVRGWVEQVDTEHRVVRLAGGREIAWDALLLATGSRSNRFGWPGEDLPGVTGLVNLQDLEALEAATSGARRAVVVGGGLIGVEMAEMLRSRDIDVTFLVREAAWMNFAFRADESSMIAGQIHAHGVDLRLGTELERILPDAAGRVRAVRTRNGEEIPCDFVGLAVGVSPNVAFLAGSGIECDRGILVDDHLRTNVPRVYAAGDCVQLREARPERRAIEPVWYVGRAMGEAVGRTLAGDPTTYEQGIWFNSAKFFDLEWQIYGDVPARLPAGRETVYWQDAAGTAAIRIDYRGTGGAVTGFNLLGVRYRQAVCARWIGEGRPIRDVLEHLGAANFDPEFHAQPEARLIAAWNREHPGDPLTLRRRRGIVGRLFGAGAA